MIPDNIHIGDRVTRFIEVTSRKATGIVVYIHPLRRYYVVEFDMGHGFKFREGFC